MEEVIELMRNDIHVNIERGDAFRVSHDSPDPLLAQQVVKRLAQLFINENLQDREKLADGTSEFLDTQLRMRNASSWHTNSGWKSIEPVTRVSSPHKWMPTCRPSRTRNRNCSNCPSRPIATRNVASHSNVSCLNWKLTGSGAGCGQRERSRSDVHGTAT